MKQYKTYLFDADGTLFDTADMIYLCFKNTFAKIGLGAISREMVFSYIGIPLKEQLKVYIGPVDDLFYEEYRCAHMDYQASIFRDHLVLFDGVRDLLMVLKENDKKCAVVTSRMRPSLELFLKELSIDSFFDLLITPESTTEHKPSSQPALKALELMGERDPSEALFIGDATFDIECGNNAGMDTAFVSWSRNLPDILSVKPTYIINKAMDIIC